jgi:hypothetical protein
MGRSRLACVWPECPNEGHFPNRDREGNKIAGTVCMGHRWMRFTPGYCDLYCQICGFGPRTSLNKHVIRFHPEVGTKEYKRRGWPLMSEDRLFMVRARFDDQIEDGVLRHRTKQSSCIHDHQLTKANTYVYEFRGKQFRQCRKCSLLRRSRVQKPKPRKCRWCKKTFQPYRVNSRHCSRLCRKREESYANSKKYRSRKCAHCGEQFKPGRYTDRYCSRLCYQNLLQERRRPKMRVCQHCGEEFQPRRANHLVCSAECHAEAARQRAKARYYALRG